MTKKANAQRDLAVDQLVYLNASRYISELLELGYANHEITNKLIRERASYEWHLAHEAMLTEGQQVELLATGERGVLDGAVEGHRYGVIVGDLRFWVESQNLKILT